MTTGFGKLAHGTVVYGLGEVLSRLTTLLLLPVFTAYLSPSDYGVIAILTSFGVLLTPVFSFGLGGAIAPVYFDGNRHERKQATIRVTFTLLAASALALVGIGVGMGPTLGRWLLGSPAYGHLVTIALTTTAATVLAIPFRQYVQFEERAKAYVIMSSASILTTTVLTVVLIAVAHRGVEGVLVAALAGQLAGLILFAGASLDAVRLRLDRPLAKELLAISVPLIPAFACLFVLQHGSKYLLQWLGSLKQVGLYTLGLNVGLVISLVVTAFQNAWIPYFMGFGNRLDEARVVFGRVTTYFMIAVGSLALMVFAVARPLILIMTRPEFHAAWRVVGLSATAQFLAGVYAVLLPGMYLAKDVQYTGLIQGIAAAVGIAANVLLIPTFGVGGAAVSLVLSYAVLCVIQYAWGLRRGYPAVDYEWGRLARFALLYAGFATAALWPRDLSLVPELILSAGLVALAAALALAQLTSAEREALILMARRLTRAAPLEQPADA